MCSMSINSVSSLQSHVITTSEPDTLRNKNLPNSLSRLEAKLTSIKASEATANDVKVACVAVVVISALTPPVISNLARMIGIGGGSLWLLKTCLDESSLRSKREVLELKIEAEKSFIQTHPGQIGNHEVRKEFVTNYMKNILEERRLLREKELADSNYGDISIPDSGISCTTECVGNACVTVCCDADGNCTSG